MLLITTQIRKSINFFHREALWKENSYISLNIEIDVDAKETEDDETINEIKFDADEDEENPQEKTCLSLNYVIGDVTKPKSSDRKRNIILHCTG